jgi:hypothetical protein
MGPRVQFETKRGKKREKQIGERLVLFSKHFGA